MTAAAPPERRVKIAELMEQQGISGDPKKHVVLFGWNRVADVEGNYQVEIKPPPRPMKVGSMIWVITQSDSANLTRAKVLEDRGDTLWVQHPERDVQFAVPFEDARFTAIPLNPLVIHRHELWKFIGRRAADDFESRRRYRRMN